MKIYLLNLEDDCDRLAHATAIFAAKGLGFERLPAVDGRKMPEAERCERLAFPAAGSFDLSPSQVGCYLSHVHAWERFLETDAAVAAIFEDDVHLGEDIDKLFDAPQTWMPDDADIVKLETCLQKVPLPEKAEGTVLDRSLVRLTGRHHGAAGYVVTRKGAEKLLANSRKLAVGVDAMMFSPQVAAESRPIVYQLEPAICIQDDVAGRTSVDRLGFPSHNVPSGTKSYGESHLARLRYRLRDRSRAFYLKARNALRGYRKRIVAFR